MTKRDPNINDPVPLEDDIFGGINQLTHSLRDLDERGLVLSLAAFAEEALGELLAKFMLPSQATNQLLEGFNAPLGTFSSRIKAAYAIGLVNEAQFQDLERLRKIRNEFAHSWKPVDLTKPKISSLIEGMAYSRISQHFPESLTEKIRSSMICLLVELRSSTQQICERGMQAKVIGTHLMCGFSGDFPAQIENARKELHDIIEGLGAFDGKKRDFYIMRLLGFKDRLRVLARPQDLEQKKAFADFLDDYKNLLERALT